MTNEQIEQTVRWARIGVGASTDESLAAIVTIAEERDRLAAQVAELVALVEGVPPNIMLALDDEDDNGVVRASCAWLPEKECWEHRRRALLARHGATP